MQLIGPLVPAALGARVEVGAVLAAKAQAEFLALDVELRRPGQPHHRSIVGLGPPVNLLCLRGSWIPSITWCTRSIASGSVRVCAAITTALVADGARRHQLSPAASRALGRALTSGVLLATLTKGNERVTVQLMGDGPVGSLTVDANGSGDVRGYALHAQAGADFGVDRNVADLVGRRGVVNVLRDLGLKELYQGQTSLVTGEVDEDIEAYLRTSEQIPSALGCDVLLDDSGTHRRRRRRPGAGAAGWLARSGARSATCLAHRRPRRAAPPRRRRRQDGRRARLHPRAARDDRRRAHDPLPLSLLAPSASARCSRCSVPSISTR